MKRGRTCLSGQDFPQATFWFYQHRMFNLNGGNLSEADTAANLSGWGKEYVQFLTEKYKDRTIHISTKWNTVEHLWTKHKQFENMGDKCFGDNKFPEATFWFFQHKIHVLHGSEYKKIGLSHSKCEQGWEELLSYLKRSYDEKMLTPFTTWGHIEFLYKNRIEPVSFNSEHT